MRLNGRRKLPAAVSVYLNRAVGGKSTGISPGCGRAGPGAPQREAPPAGSGPRAGAALTFGEAYNTVDFMRFSRRWPAVAIVLMLVFSACSGKLSKQTGLTDSDLLARGEQKFAKKKYSAAIEHFQLLLERFPASPLAARAQLLLGDARMENKDDIEAEVAFDDFLRLYPASDNVAYALFRKGELLARQVGDPARDQTKTREAVKTFAQLLEKDPNGPYAARAGARIGELRARMAAHEERVVSHYLKRKKYDSAESRARRALAEYPDTKETPRLLELLAEALDGQGRKADAAGVRKSLAEKFPERGAKTR